MKRILISLAILAPMAAMAGTPSPLGPDNGKFGDWTAATYGTGAATICYAFTKPQTSSPSLPGRGLAMLTVTERSGSRDEISLTPGYTYPKSATVSVVLGNDTIPFYVQDNIAFTNSTKAALAGFARENAALATSTGPKHRPVTDKFSLSGFSDAYKAITSACPK
ncbi:hypothetical protein [Acidocella sp.]|uniref:hypothetical protein n=1 Tax=Acidocella sp. TaxID=50710 RepID=UPI002604FADF|nr:hypothetical protein [Acidocella sp.]